MTNSWNLPSSYEGAWLFSDWKDFCEHKTNAIRKYRQSMEPLILKELLTPSPGDIILEAGIGYGRLSQHICNLDIRLVGLDVSSSMVRYCQKMLGAHVALIQADIRNLPFDSNTFSHVLCNGVLVHNRDATTAISELCRVLKFRGTIVLSANNSLSPWAWFPNILSVINRYLHLWKAPLMIYRTPVFYIRVLRLNGCRTTRMVPDTLAAVDPYVPGTHKSLLPSCWLYLAKIIDKIKDTRLAKYFGWEIWYQAIKEVQTTHGS